MSNIKKGDQVIIHENFEVVSVRERTATITIDRQITLIVDKDYLTKIK